MPQNCWKWDPYSLPIYVYSHNSGPQLPASESYRCDRFWFAPIQMICSNRQKNQPQEQLIDYNLWVSGRPNTHANTQKKIREEETKSGVAFCLGYQPGFCRHHLASEDHPPITCLISRCPNSPQERIHCGSPGFCLGLSSSSCRLADWFSWCWRAKMFTILLLIFCFFFFCSSQWQAKLKRFPLAGPVWDSFFILATQLCTGHMPKGWTGHLGERKTYLLELQPEWEFS